MKSLRTRARFVPRAEALEERTVLSCTTSFNPATGALVITGTNQADHIRIVDTGSPSAAGAVQVFCEGILKFSSPAVGLGIKSVSSVKVDTLAGNDTVDYQLTGNLLFAQRAVSVDLGRGNDRFGADLHGSLGFAGKLDFKVQGGEGRDLLAARSTGDVFGPFFALPASSLQFTMNGGDDRDVLAVNLSGTVHSGARLGVDLQGGRDGDAMSIGANMDVQSNGLLDLAMRGQLGDDREALNYTGQVKGTLRTQQDGGPGDDLLSTFISLAPGSTGTVQARQQGGPDRDRMTMIVRKQAAFDPVTIDARADGGPGFDVLHKTANVVATNCEVVILVP